MLLDHRGQERRNGTYDKNDGSWKTAADLSIGAGLTVLAVWGIVANFLAFSFFIRSKNQGRNRLYFNRLYTVITAIDFLICITLFPVVETAFSKRNPKLFNVTEFCAVWSIVWRVLPDMSVFLVGMMSFSRLYIVVFPRSTLRSSLGYVLPGLYFIFTLALLLSYRFTGIMSAKYNSPEMSCMVIANLTEVEKEIIGSTEWNKKIVIWVTASVQKGMTIIPITLSFFMILIFLQRSKKKAKAGASANAQSTAERTITLVYLVYAFCNIPVLIYYVYYVRWIFKIEPEEITYAALKKSYDQHFETTFMVHYLWVLTYNVSVILNCAINPIIYWWRMDEFRVFVKEIMGDKKNGGENGMVITNEMTVRRNNGVVT